MATITALKPAITGAVAAFTASTVTGDEITYTQGGDLLIEINNGHDASITVSIAPTVTTGRIPGAGPAAIPTRSIAVAAGAHAAFLFKGSEISAYKNAHGRIPLSYTSGNVALVVRAFEV